LGDNFFDGGTEHGVKLFERAISILINDCNEGGGKGKRGGRNKGIYAQFLGKSEYEEERKSHGKQLP
jgi:hypothetical protein